MDIFNQTINLPIAPEFLWLILAILIIVFISISTILTYHWKSYGIYHNPKIFAKSIFWIISILFIFIMTLAVTGFENL